MDEEDTSLDLSYYQPSTPYHKKISALDPTIYNPTTPDGDHFCTPGNLSATAEYVNHQLISHGYPAPLRFINNDKSDASKIINCIFALLQQIEKDNGQHEDMMDNLHNQQSENGALTTNMAKLKQQLEQSERNVDTLKAKLNTCEENLKAETSRHKDTHEELQKAKQNLQHIKTQYAHELRKREQEYGKLKDRMQKVLNDKYKGSKISLTLVNPAPKSSTLPSKSDLSQDEEMFRENLNNYEERERMVLDENQSLRNALITLYQEIEILLRGQVAREGRTLEVPVPSGSVNARYNLRSSTISNSDHRFSSASFQQSPSAPITAETARFQMPFDMTGANIVKDLKVLLAMLKEEWEGRPANKKLLITQEREHEMKEKDKEIEKQRMEIDDLVAQLEEKRFVAEEQNKLIDRFLSGNFFQNANEEDMLNMSGMELTIPEVDEEAASLRHMREQLDQERRQFTEAAIKMGRERAALRAEREAFEEEKRSLQTQALLFSLPETPYWLKRQQAGPAQSTPILAASINSVDFELLSPFASPEPSINSKLSKNRTPYSAERAASRKAQSKDEDDDLSLWAPHNIRARPSQRDELPTRRVPPTLDPSNSQCR
ncbi:Afadin and alpha-actinin-binding-domain-containing protein [Endogone sp. FLAS-F59071]|nr:Afadin and alpha-actinin-binding-domain-containing protein [Endogone sp. FLAS-F59071]|eukprot:RUS20402.1 Afadin and alpha-actinin-binding-domain-containing protein [Endogone sp. FLAS-F59071]